MTAIGPDVAELKLVPSAGGVFEVTVNDQLVFSKRELERHAEPGELLPLIRNAL